jgi:glyoxylase-like metal-dependent hydrolase (beta-lactamase superfamily II)
MPTHFICVTCGTQFAASEQEPTNCPICTDERQYVGVNGQQWTTLAMLQKDYRNSITLAEPNLHVIQTEPKFGIGQRAFLVRTNEGNLLWDCVTLINDDTVKQLRELGGIKALAISHPHYYSSMIEWSRAFGDIPIYLHRDDSEWVMRPDDRIRFWDGENKELFGGLNLVRLGGHFTGFQVLHWPTGAEQRGVMFVGDQPFVCQDRRWVSFMYSYPNLIPLSPTAIRHIANTLDRYSFDRLYGAFAGQLVITDAKEVVQRSAERYLRFTSESP